MFDDPSYNEPVTIYESKVFNRYYWKHFTTGKEIKCFKHPITNRYKIIKEDYNNMKFYFYYLSDSLSLHRENGPAFIQTCNGTVLNEEYYELNIPHRLNGPQRILYSENKIRAKYYRINGELHRENGPAYTVYFPGTNKIHEEIYYICGKKYRENGPAHIIYNSHGARCYEVWYKNNLFHRLDGPAVIECDFTDGQRTNSLWFLKGRPLDTDNLPIFERGKVVGKVKLTKANVLKAFLFDREYGDFAKQIYDKSKI